MIDCNELTPKQTAVNLRLKYNSHAVFIVCLEAHKAVNERDLSGCLYWNEVLKILDAENDYKI